ncbi:MAG: PTS sugar transporter subunit IIA [Deltaproteobacteria bacterium]|nr:PTS sugar transporter subunit IIA [Deltaproteobacteria bacterium]
MKLRIKDAAALLHVSEKTIYRWVAQAKLPFHRISNQYRFNRAELLEWATSNRVPISPRILEEPEGAVVPSLAEALQTGGIHYRVEGRDKAAVLNSVVNILALPQEVDREFLYQVLLARESLGSTAIGGGIAIPHVRNPIALHVPRPLVALCFLEHAIDFQAIDGRPVHTLFTIVSPTIKAHLNLLSKLSFGLRASEFADAVARIDSRDTILQAASLLDAHLAEKIKFEVKQPS